MKKKTYLDDKRVSTISKIVDIVVFIVLVYYIAKLLDDMNTPAETIAGIIFIVIIFGCAFFFDKTLSTASDARHNLISILDDNFTNYVITNAHGKECKDNCEFSEFYVLADDTVYKCKYTSSSNELYMQKIPDLPIVLKGKEKVSIQNESKHTKREDC